MIDWRWDIDREPPTQETISRKIGRVVSTSILPRPNSTYTFLIRSGVTANYPTPPAGYPTQIVQGAGAVINIPDGTYFIRVVVSDTTWLNFTGSISAPHKQSYPVGYINPVFETPMVDNYSSVLLLPNKEYLSDILDVQQIGLVTRAFEVLVNVSLFGKGSVS